MIEKQEETEMRLKLLSPGEMNESQKQTYDESIAGKRGAPPAPMMAWLNSPEMARHATRLGAVLRFDTMFPAKLSEIAILVTARHWTAHYEWWAHKRLALNHRRHQGSPHAPFRRSESADDLRRRQIAARGARAIQDAVR
jgi:4-carboxymuconolactone decarboxylase